MLDALGLPRGDLQLSQSVYLTDQTTVRAGDSFGLKITGTTGTTQATIRIDPDETMQSLATKINTWLGNKGKASVSYNNQGAATLRLSVNAGVEAQLSSGPASSNALAGLGLSPGIIVKDAAKTTAATTSSTTTKQLPVYGLSIPTGLDLSTQDAAKKTKGQLLAVLSTLRTTYRTSNTPVTTTYTNTQTGKPAPAYLTSQLGSYNYALQELQAMTGGTGTTA